MAYPYKRVAGKRKIFLFLSKGAADSVRERVGGLKKAIV